jgi:hypothetical protein
LTRAPPALAALCIPYAPSGRSDPKEFLVIYMSSADPSTLLRSLSLAALAALVGAGCGSDNVAPVELTGTSQAEPVTPQLTVTYAGIPFGPFGLWRTTTLLWGPEPFTASHNAINADTLILQINAARNKGQRLIVAMAGGGSSRYTTNGQFDMTKWKNVMSTYRKASLKSAVAAAVADGTIIGDMLIDEPETDQWGTVLTKAKIDQMAAYVKSIFPTLPVGVNHGATGYKWRPTERYTKVDYANYQYVHWITQGDLTLWRDGVLAQAKLDGVTPSFSLNILNGGVQDKDDGVYDCVGTGMGGLGSRYPLCWMTPDQLRSWGTTLAPLGCAMLLWRFDQAYMSEPANLSAFTDIATVAASAPRRSCKRV